MSLKFVLTSDYKPAGDQPQAIEKLVRNFNNNINQQVLLGATGTGKTFTIANVINKIQKNTLVIVHNKTLAAQLYSEFKQLFKNNRVEYFVSYFDFYQPEAYIPRKDLYIEKNAVTNQEIEMLRLSTINSLSTNEPVIVIASVAAIYSSVPPEDFNEFRIVVTTNQHITRKHLTLDLVRLQYQHKEDLAPGSFRFKGDVLELAPGFTDTFSIRISFNNDVIEQITKIDSLTGEVIEKLKIFEIVPATEYIMNHNRMEQSINRIKQEMINSVKKFKLNNKLLEAQRIEQRTNSDMEALQEFGYCNGIENYARHLELRDSNSTPSTIFDYLKSDWLLVIDESHMTIPQIIGMYNTDRSRKQTLVEHGFRLPSALDNRPLNFKEFLSKIKKAIYVSATPSKWEIEQSNNNVIQQIVRPTGLVDPIIEIRNNDIPIEDLIVELKKQVESKNRTFITVLTIALAENLTEYLIKHKFKVAYLHNKLKTLERAKIVNDLRRGKYDILVGINLLREGLDVPEVSLVVIFDADKTGLFRNETSLIQTFGRAARNKNGRVILYAKQMTESIKTAIDETERRRKLQTTYNTKHKIIPQTIIKPIFDDISTYGKDSTFEQILNSNKKADLAKKTQALKNLHKEMLKAARNKEYERAAYIRDIILSVNENKID